jgi:hypothetical protein
MLITPERNRRGCFVGFIVVATVLVPLAIAAFFVYSTFSPGAQQNISMQPHPTIIVEHQSIGTVRVHANTGGNAIQITGWKQGMSYTQNQATNTLSIDMSRARGFYDNITISAPANTDLKMDVDNIEVFGITGQMTLITHAGTVTLAQSTLTGKSSIQGGRVIFQGTIDPQGTCSFDTNSDSIDLTLPKNASFHLDIKGILGPVVSTFPEIEAQVKDVYMNEIRTDVGSDPGATIEMSVNSTVIVINGA